VRKTVECVKCGKPEAVLPRTAVVLIATALCVSCALTIHETETEAEKARYALDGQRKATRAAREGIVAGAANACVNTSTENDHLLTGGPNGALIILDSVEAANLLAYRNMWLLAESEPARFRRIGGGPESLTLAAHSKAGFDAEAGIRKTFLSPLFTAVIISGITGGGFMSEKRRLEEWVTLADQVERSNQFLTITVGSLKSGTEHNPEAIQKRLGQLIGPETARRLQIRLGVPIIG
jgi:hypothetical protein